MDYGCSNKHDYPLGVERKIIMESITLLQLKVDMQLAMKEEVRLRKSGITDGDEFDKAVCHKTVSRSIISMFPSIGKKPGDAIEDDTQKLLKKYIGQEKEKHPEETHDDQETIKSRRRKSD